MSPKLRASSRVSMAAATRRKANEPLELAGRERAVREDALAQRRHRLRLPRAAHSLDRDPRVVDAERGAQLGAGRAHGAARADHVGADDPRRVAVLADLQAAERAVAQAAQLRADG